MALISTRLDRIFVDKVSELRQDLSGKWEIYAVIETKSFCPNCIWDATSRCSTGVYKTGGTTPFTGKECPVCDNAGKVSIKTNIQLTATISTLDDKSGDSHDIQGDMPAGTMKLKTDPENADLLRTALYFLVNGNKYSRVTSEPKITGLLTPATAKIFIKRDE